eukprot:6182976-Pleurochrysis_carterae.AAC.2
MQCGTREQRRARQVTNWIMQHISCWAFVRNSPRPWTSLLPHSCVADRLRRRAGIPVLHLSPTAPAAG